MIYDYIDHQTITTLAVACAVLFIFVAGLVVGYAMGRNSAERPFVSESSNMTDKSIYDQVEDIDEYNRCREGGDENA